MTGAGQWNLDRRSFLEERLRGDPKRTTAVFETEVEWSGGAAADLALTDGTLRFDLPEWAGGGGSGLHPVEGVLAALGADLAAGLSLAAATAGVEIRSLRLHVEGGVDLARAAAVVDGRPLIDQVQVEVSIDARAERATVQEWLATAVARSPLAGLFAAAGEPVQARLVEDS